MVWVLSRLILFISPHTICQGLVGSESESSDSGAEEDLAATAALMDAHLARVIASVSVAPFTSLTSWLILPFFPLFSLLYIKDVNIKLYVLHLVIKVRAKDPRIYDEQQRWFPDSDGEGDAEKNDFVASKQEKKKKLRFKDMVRDQVKHFEDRQ